MGHKSIGYHTRKSGQDSVKLTGGSFGGAVDMETVNRLVKSHFTVKVKNSGHAVFVDREGREVSVYITVDASSTDAGKAALVEYRKEVEARQVVEQEKERRVQELIDSMSSDEVIKRLEG